jgi:5-methylcytosine-specific restriction protein B
LSDLEADAIEVLGLLRRHLNVLISGPPATGKTALLSKVAELFRGIPTVPPHDKGAAVPIPKAGAVSAAFPWLPSPSCSSRQVFRTVFHQNSKYRDFVSGLMPDLDEPGAFSTSIGVLLRANLFASESDGTALIIIDEINRGPAVQLFGGAIVSMERDKRGDSEGDPTPSTVTFDALMNEGIEEIALSGDLYILGAMNQADTSVEALDVAFLRRWESFRVEPSSNVLMIYLGVAESGDEPPATPETAADVYRVAIYAWQAINDRIAVGRGPEYRLGHGVFMAEPVADTVIGAAEHISRAWAKVQAHIDEIFFGDARGVAAVLNLLSGPNPVASYETILFGDEPREIVTSPSPIPVANLYEYLFAVAKDGTA